MASLADIRQALADRIAEHISDDVQVLAHMPSSMVSPVVYVEPEAMDRVSMGQVRYDLVVVVAAAASTPVEHVQAVLDAMLTTGTDESVCDALKALGALGLPDTTVSWDGGWSNYGPRQMPDGSTMYAADLTVAVLTTEGA